MNHPQEASPRFGLLRRITFLLLCFGGAWLQAQDSLFQAKDSLQTPDSLFQAQDSLLSILVDESFRVGRIKKAIYYWADTTGEISYPAITSYLPSFKNSIPVIDSLPFESGVWAYIKVKNTGEDSLKFILSVGNVAEATFFFTDSSGLVTAPKYSGILISKSKRDQPFPKRSAASLELGPKGEQEIWVQMKRGYNMGINIYPYLYHPTNWDLMVVKNRFGNVVFTVGFLSILGIILLYNLMIFFSTRDQTYLYYSLYLLSIFGVIYFENVVRDFASMGFEKPVWHMYLAYICFEMVNMFIFLFGRKFLDAPTLTPKWDKWIKVIIGLRILWLLISICIIGLGYPIDICYVGAFILLMVETVFLVGFFIHLALLKSRVAWFFIIGTGLVYIFGFVFLILRNLLGIDLSAYYFIFSVLAEILLFSLGLGYKFRQQQKEKLAAQTALNQELSKINTAFGRFVPHEFLKSLGHESVLDVKLGDQVEKEVTVLFSDIRGYTTLAEQMSPEENFRFLNAYLGRMGPIVQENRGFVNQYYGDGIMALFLHEADEALRAGVGMFEALRMYNEERADKDRRPLHIGLGLHTGSLMMGIIGDTLRLEAGVVSDTVNTASRMEGLTKHFGGNLILSEAVYQRLNKPESFSFRYLGKVQVKGRKEPTDIYECLDAEEPVSRAAKQQHREAFHTALAAYAKQDFAQAIATWEEILSAFPEDHASQYYIPKARHYLLEGVPENWTGVEALVFK
ncbi:MAG: adenylate/guanylate cyclase domain-containing protein [Bacteroidota bacterium]